MTDARPATIDGEQLDVLDEQDFFDLLEMNLCH
jgi:hypothetical protein